MLDRGLPRKASRYQWVIMMVDTVVQIFVLLLIGKRFARNASLFCLNYTL